MIKYERKTNFTSIFYGLGVAYLITIVIFFITALLLTYTNFEESKLSMIVIITTIISTFIGGIISAKTNNKKGWLWGLILGLLYMIILIIISSNVNNQFIMDKNVMTIGFISICSGMLGGMLGINIKK